MLIAEIISSVNQQKKNKSSRKVWYAMPNYFWKLCLLPFSTKSFDRFFHLCRYGLPLLKDICKFRAERNLHSLTQPLFLVDRPKRSYALQRTIRTWPRSEFRQMGASESDLGWARLSSQWEKMGFQCHCYTAASLERLFSAELRNASW
jgi:hypothetical protein